MGPQRIQLRRTAGWRMPPGTVHVARPTRWGNPFNWTDYPRIQWAEGDPVLVSEVQRRVRAVKDFRSLLLHRTDDSFSYPSYEEIRAELAGKNLGCWCPLSQPCHADVLLHIANPEECQG